MKPTSTLHTLRAATMVAALLALTACGGGDDPTVAQGPVPTPAPAPVPGPAPSMAPVISQDLPAQLALEEGTGVTIFHNLSVAATSPDGSALSYQWYREGSSCCSNTANLEVYALPFSLTPQARTFRVDVSNAGGTTRSADVQVVQHPRVWTDVASAHASTERASGDTESQSLEYVAHADDGGRSHVATAVTSTDNGTMPRIVLKGVARNAQSDTWAYEQAIPLRDASAVAKGLKMASHWTGYVFLTWYEHSSDAGRTDVRAALYVPAADASLPGTWHELGRVNSTTATIQALEPSVVSMGGAFMVAWIQANASFAADAVARTYTVPAPGEALSTGWGAYETIENVPESVTALRLVVAYPNALAVFRRGGNEQNWHYNWRRAGSWDATPQDLGISGAGYPRVDAALGLMGSGLLAATDTLGRVHVRRLDVTTASFSDNIWGYRANAYGSAPAMLVDNQGNIDIFGVSVNTSAGNTSVLAHWRWTTADNWSAAKILLNNSANFAQGHGLRSPVVARDDAGNLVLAYAEGEGSGVAHKLKAMRYSQGDNAWSVPVQVATAATTGNDQTQPQLAVNKTGRATVVWGESAQGGAAVIRHARLR